MLLGQVQLVNRPASHLDKPLVEVTATTSSLADLMHLYRNYTIATLASSEQLRKREKAIPSINSAAVVVAASVQNFTSAVSVESSSKTVKETGSNPAASAKLTRGLLHL